MGSDPSMHERGSVDETPLPAAGDPVDGAPVDRGPIAHAEISTAVPRAGITLAGTRVAPGLATGPLLRVEPGSLGGLTGRIPLDRVEEELNRFHSALEESPRQLEETKRRLSCRVLVGQ